jgi:hypothetical protein
MIEKRLSIKEEEILLYAKSGMTTHLDLEPEFGLILSQ